jgi:hypothetical protein
MKVVEAAKRKGLFVVVMHSTPIDTTGPYGAGAKLIDLAIEIEDWYDFDELISRLHSALPDGKVVGTYACVEVAIEFESFIRQKAQLPTNTPQQSAFLLDKYLIRKKLYDDGITSLRPLSKQEVDALESWPYECAAYLKPVHGGGSLLVTRCRNMRELRVALEAWQQQVDSIEVPFYMDFFNQNNAYFLEPEAIGKLISLEALNCFNTCHVLGLTSRLVLEENPSIEMGAGFPFFHPEFKRIEEKVKNAHAALNYTHGPTHTELMIDADGNIEIIEVNPRFIGSDMLMVINQALDTPIEDVLVDLGLGHDIGSVPRPKKAASLQLMLPPKSLQRFEGITFEQDDDICFLRIMKNKGDVIGSSTRQIDQMVAFIVEGNDHDDAIYRGLKHRRTLKINGQSWSDEANNQVV